MHPLDRYSNLHHYCLARDLIEEGLNPNSGFQCELEAIGHVLQRYEAGYDTGFNLIEINRLIVLEKEMYDILDGRKQEYESIPIRQRSIKQAIKHLLNKILT